MPGLSGHARLRLGRHRPGRRACLELAARASLAQQDAVAPLLLAAASAVVSVAIGALLMAPLGHSGMASARPVAIPLEVLALLALMHRHMRDVGGRKPGSLLGRVRLASAAMGAVMFA